jgi:hypothetical protein
VIHGLHWVADTELKTKTNDAPSWSWASQQGDFSYIHCFQLKDATFECTFVRAEIDYVNAQGLFGGVNSGALTLRGKLLSTTRKEDGCLELSLPQKVLQIEPTWDDHRYDAIDICIMVLPISTIREYCKISINSLLVTPCVSDSNRYIRIGAWEITDREENRTATHPLFSIFDSLPESEITIA